MPSRHNTKDDRLRQLIAQEAARIMVEDHLEDYYRAKRKAVDRLNLGQVRNLPGNDEIEKAIKDYQRLFKSEIQPTVIADLRRAALRAMEFFARYQPRLVGPVLHGTANEHSTITLHVFCDTPEELGIILMDERIPYENGERRIKYGNGHIVTYPTYRFIAGAEQIEIVVLPYDGIREAPLSEVDGRPMPRASIAEVRRMMEK